MARSKTEQVKDIVAHFERKGPALFTKDGNSRAMNGWASAFWAGYDGMTSGVRVPPSTWISYPWYVAGKKAAKKSKA
jgi:hypothetical protein